MKMNDLSEQVLRGAHAADELRLSLGIGVEPIGDLWGLIRGQGVELAFNPFGTGGPDGVYRYDGQHALIVINSSKQPIARQRFTAAHELGHHLLHRKAGQPMQASDTDIFATGGITGKADSEKEADAFAGYLLAPTGAMAQAFGGKDRSLVSAEDVVDLMHKFGTTFRTTVFRLHNSDRIAAADRDRLIRESQGRVESLRVQKGHDREEVSGAPLPPSFVTTVVSQHARGVIDDERLAALLRTSREEALRLAVPRPDDQFDDDDLADAFREIDATLSELDQQ